MAAERAWVETVKADIERAMAGKDIVVETGHRLPYAVFVTKYKGRPGQSAVSQPIITSHGYQTDLLIAERLDAEHWIPRVVIEFKLGTINTHEALTYSAKAATHKNCHPYLRYGLVIGRYSDPVPQRLLRHGHHFDFMVTLASEKLTASDSKKLVQLFRKEVNASRTLESLLEDSDIWLLHRRLEVGRLVRRC
jgi:hypothetical protein